MRRFTWRKAMFRETSIRWLASILILTVLGRSKISLYWTSFCVWSDNSGGAAYGADLQSGVSSEAARDLPPETERSAPQQRRTSIPTTRQSGCTQRLVLSRSKSPKIENMVLILSLQEVAGSAKRSLDQHCHHRVNGTDRNRRTGLALDTLLTQVRNTPPRKKTIHLTLEPIDCKS